MSLQLLASEAGVMVLPGGAGLKVWFLQESKNNRGLRLWPASPWDATTASPAQMCFSRQEGELTHNACSSNCPQHLGGSKQTLGHCCRKKKKTPKFWEEHGFSLSFLLSSQEIAWHGRWIPEEDPSCKGVFERPLLESLSFQAGGG